MMFFDCCCEIGPRHSKDPAAPWSAHDVLRWMDHCRIDGALVVHTLTHQYDPVYARARLAAEIAPAADRLFPVWAALPPDAGDFEPRPEELLDAMARADVRAVKLFPKSHAYPFSPVVLGPTLRALEQKHLLTLIDFAELPEGTTAAFSALHEMLDAFPALPVLLQRARWGMQRLVTALMARHENLHLEFSSYQISRGIEEYVRRFGAERLLFGTGLPAMSAGAARAYIDYARVPDDAKEKIAGGNLARLLGGVRPGPAPPGRRDPLRDRAAAGEPLDDLEVLDAHCHVLHEGGQGAGPTVMYSGDADGLVEMMDVMGVDKAAMMSWSGPVGSDAVSSNEIVARAVAKHPDRILGVAYINPTHVSPDALAAEVRARVETEGFVGLKPYRHVGLPYTDERYAPCWAYADAHGLYTLLHLGGPDTARNTAAVLAAKYPRAQWVIAHTGGSFEMARAVAEVMKDHANIWAELTLTPVTNGVIEWLVAAIGDDRILYGSDAPMRDPRQQLGWVVWADIPLESRRRILGANFKRLLGMRTTKGGQP